MRRSETNRIGRMLADHWGLSQAQVHVGVRGKVMIDKSTEKTPPERNGIIFEDTEELCEYLEERGL